MLELPEEVVPFSFGKLSDDMSLHRAWFTAFSVPAEQRFGLFAFLVVWFFMVGSCLGRNGRGVAESG